MKSLLKILFFLAVGCASLNAFAQYADLPEENLFPGDERRYGHLQYFGFYASAMGNWNYTRELAPFTNLTWIHVGSGDDVANGIESLLQRLREAKESGVQATLSIESFLFQDDEGELWPETRIVDFLVELRAQMEFEDLLDTLAMIYPKDEPYRSFVDARDPNFIEEHITGKVYDDVYEVLNDANELIKLVFPEKPIGVILSGHEVFNNFVEIPANYDWIGFDCYDNLFKSCDDRSFVRLYKKLLDLMQAHQQLMAVPETWVQNEDMDRSDWPDVLLSRLRHHYEIALNEPRFVAFIPFLWSFDSNIEIPGLGLNRFAEIFDDGIDDRGTNFVHGVKNIGEQIKFGQPVFPNMAHGETEDSKHRPESNIRGEIMSITQQGLVSAWAFEDALPHKNLRVQVRVRNDLGRIIYKSPLERTFIYDPNLSDENLIGRTFLGLPGYRHQLPPEIITQKKARRLAVELLVYADGSELNIGYIYSMKFAAEDKTLPGARRQSLRF